MGIQDDAFVGSELTEDLRKEILVGFLDGYGAFLAVVVPSIDAEVPEYSLMMRSTSKSMPLEFLAERGVL